MIEKNLREKDVLLQEVHHRVKNNLQIIISLLSLQISKIGNKEIIEQLEIFEKRVITLAGVHDEVYHAIDFEGIEFCSYLRQLCSDIAFRYSRDESINITYELQPIYLTIERALNLSLITNELVTNSCKYGKTDASDLEVFIQCRVENQFIILTISDNGGGFSEDSTSKHSGIGLELVEILVDQLNGDLNHRTDNGVTWELTIPLLDP